MKTVHAKAYIWVDVLYFCELVRDSSLDGKPNGVEFDPKVSLTYDVLTRKALRVRWVNDISSP